MPKPWRSGEDQGQGITLDLHAPLHIHTAHAHAHAHVHAHAHTPALSLLSSPVSLLSVVSFVMVKVY